MKKPLKIVLIVIVAIVVLVAVLYKPMYNYIAPKVFDYLLEDNLDKLIVSLETKDDNEDKTEESSEIRNENTEIEESTEIPKGEESENKEGQGENETKSKSKASANSPLNENNVNGVYKSKTSAGVFDENDLANIAKRISPADKTKIISIVQSCISPGDYPDLAKRAKNLNHENMAYLESYLRSHMSGAMKKQILDIVVKYK